MWPDRAFAEFITEIEASWVDGVHVFFPKSLVRKSWSLDWTDFQIEPRLLLNDN